MKSVVGSPEASRADPGRPGSATLLERELELTELGDALTRAREGNGQVVLIEAPAGLGKTSLLNAAGEIAADAGFTCLRARATELERDFAYCSSATSRTAVCGSCSSLSSERFRGPRTAACSLVLQPSRCRCSLPPASRSRLRRTAPSPSCTASTGC